MIIDGKEWRLVPVDPPESAIDAACREHKSGVMCLARQNFVRNWRKMLAAAPAPPVVEVTDLVAEAVFRAWIRNAGNHETRADDGRNMIAAVQSILGPTLGMISREEMAQAAQKIDDQRESLREHMSMVRERDAEIAALRADSARLDWLLHWLADPVNCRNIRFDRAMIDAEIREGGGNG